MSYDIQTNRPEGRDITRFADAPSVYPPYSVRIEEDPRAFDLHSIWGFLRRNWWIIGAFLIAGVGIAYWHVQRTTPIYQSQTSIRIENTQRGANPTGFEMASYVGGSELSTDMEILRSRSLAEQVVDSLKLQVQLLSPRYVSRERIFSSIEIEDDSRLSPGRFTLKAQDGDEYALAVYEGPRVATVRIGEPFEVGGTRLVLAEEAGAYDEIEIKIQSTLGAAGYVRGNLRIGRPTEDYYMGIVQLVYNTPDRALAAEVPNALAEQFIAHRQREHKKRAKSTVEFLTGQLDTLSVQLREAEEDLRQYREEQQVVNLEAEGTSEIGQMAQAEAQRNQIRVQRNTLQETIRDAAGAPSDDPMAPSPYRRLVSNPALLSNPAMSSMLANLTTLENERAELLERRTMQDPQVEAINQRINSIESQIESHARTYLEGLNNQLATLGSVVGESRGQLSQIPRKEVGLVRRQQQAHLLRETYVLLQTRLKEAQITQAVEDPNVSVVDQALVPGKPIKPNRASTLMLGAFLGLLLGAGASYTREYFDKTIHTRDQLKEMTGVPVLGLIPRIAGLADALPTGNRKLLGRGAEGTAGERNGSGEVPARLVAEHDRTNAVSEAYRSLRTNITFSSAERLSKVFVLTSPTPQDGKTTTCANLAITFAQQGLRVLLMDADMRRGTLHKLFQVSRTPGLSNVVVEDTEIDEAIRFLELGGQTEIDVMPTGTVPPNPAELLSSKRFRSLMESLRERYDAIVIDTPPLTLVTDAAVLSAHADSMLLVARANQTEEGAVHFALEQLRNVDAPLSGTILNDVDYKRDSKYGGYSYYGYSYDYSSLDKS